MTDSSGFRLTGPDTLRGAVLFLLVGLSLTGYGVYDYVQQSEPGQNAVKVNATITEVGVETNPAGSSGRSAVTHEPVVRFTYEYQGTSHTGTNVFPADTAPRYNVRSEAESAVREYEQGMTVTAYVIPDEPDDAFLKTNISNAPLIAGWMGAILLLLGAVSILQPDE